MSQILTLNLASFYLPFQLIMLINRLKYTLIKIRKSVKLFVLYTLRIKKIVAKGYGIKPSVKEGKEGIGR